MNRLHHLKQTLRQNLDSNTDPSTKFLVLDYNSRDGLAEYIVDNYAEELENGKLEYRRYNDAIYFSHSHSRNLAVRHIDTPFICNVDADNFTGKDFDKYLLKKFHEPDTVVTAISNEKNIYGAFGRMATSRDRFLQVGGYDETFDGYGFEDYDLIHRLEEFGLYKRVINEPEFLQSIPHDNSERVACEWTNDKLLHLYRQQVNDSIQVLLYLFSDGTMHYGVVNEDFDAGVHYRYSLAGDKWQTGTWRDGDNHIIIQFEKFTATFGKEKEYLIGNRHCLKREQDPEKLQEAILFHTNMANCCRYQLNKKNNIIRVNEHGFGEGATEALFIQSPKQPTYAQRTVRYMESPGSNP